MVIHDGVYNDEIRDFLKENNLDVPEGDFEAISEEVDKNIQDYQMEVTYAICDAVEKILNIEISKYHYYERKNIPISEVIEEIVAIMDTADSRMFDHILSGKEKIHFHLANGQKVTFSVTEYK